MVRQRTGRGEVSGIPDAGAAGTAFRAPPTKGAHGANDRLRIGLIGCGAHGNVLLKETLKLAQSFNVEVSALCDVWKVNLEKTAVQLHEKQGTKPETFSRYGDMLTMKDLDAIIIATPDFAHTPILLEATKLKKDAYVEKPMATVLDHAKAAMMLAKENKTVVQIGTQRRSDPRHQAAAMLVQTGILGKVSKVEAAWHDAAPRWARDYSDVRREDVDWEQYLMFLPKEPFSPVRFRRWQLFKDFTLGVPALFGSHLMDVAAWFMDDPLPLSAVAHGGAYVWKDGREHADTIDCVFEYPKGFLLNYASRLGNNKPVPEVTFYGTRGTFDTQSFRVSGEGGGQGALQVAVAVLGSDACPASFTAGDLSFSQAARHVGVEGHVRDWLKCVRSRDAPNAPIEAGYAHSVASIMAFNAWESGKRQVYDARKMEIKAT